MTQQDLISSTEWPAVVIETIYSAYPRKKGKDRALTCIRQALNRIIAGEIDGKVRTQEEAILFLRQAVNNTRKQMFGRMSQYIPHPSTYFRQSRYLHKLDDGVPKALGECKSILEAYPGIHITSANIDAHMPVLRIIDECIRGLQSTHGQAAASYIRQRVYRFAECVTRWQDSDKQYIPGAKRFFEEHRYEQGDCHWERKPAGFSGEREQLSRILGGRQDNSSK